MPRMIHLSRASLARSIERVGLRGEKVSILGPGEGRVDLKKAVFAMPQLRDFSISHQWLRELRRWHDERMVAVHFRLPSEEPVWVGHYSESHVLLPLGEAIRRLAASPLGQVLIGPRSVGRREIASVRDVTQLVGWVGNPEREKLFDCLCQACLPAGSRDLMRRIRGAFNEHLREAGRGGSANETASALVTLDMALERAKGRIPAKKLLSYANSPHAQVRRVATALLGYFRWPEVEETLAERITDDHPEVRHAAFEAMVRSGGLRRAYAGLDDSADELLLRLLDELESPRSVNEALAILDAMAGKHSMVVQRRISEVRESLRQG